MTLNEKRFRPDDRTSLPFLLCLLFIPMAGQHSEQKPKIREFGIEVGILPVGTLNAITDVSGVKGGQTTIIRGEISARVSPQSFLMGETSSWRKRQEQFSSAMLLEN